MTKLRKRMRTRWRLRKWTKMTKLRSGLRTRFRFKMRPNMT